MGLPLPSTAVIAKKKGWPAVVVVGAPLMTNEATVDCAHGSWKPRTPLGVARNNQPFGVAVMVPTPSGLPGGTDSPMGVTYVVAQVFVLSVTSTPWLEETAYIRSCVGSKVTPPSNPWRTLMTVSFWFRMKVAPFTCTAISVPLRLTAVVAFDSEKPSETGFEKVSVGAL